MNYLLDTHAITWLVEDSTLMPITIKELVRNQKNNNRHKYPEV